mmetsp:Transcript_75139/g.220216  ORF Transcript_75139/g.220216 Transcript_75139/m.220216 type:complete len:377 (-) Transcript_75139:60-1190(-)
MRPFLLGSLMALLPRQGLSALMSCDLRQGDAVEWDAGAQEYRVSREGATIGFMVGADQQRVRRAEPVPWSKVRFVQDEKERWVLEDRSFQVATFTDVIRLRHDPAVSIARYEARIRGCWSAGGYTPDLCCSNGGWSECWDGPFSYESCCMGWTGNKNDDFLASVRLAFGESQGVLISDPASHSPFYVHGILLGTLVAATAGNKPLVLAEVGVDEGPFAVHIMRELRRRGLTVERYYAVDPWAGPHTYAGDRSRQAYLTATKALAEFWPAPRVLQERGDLAVTLVPDGLADFVFIDAIHDFEHVSKHLELWWPKVRPGGLIGGHDYSPEKPGAFPGCVRAAQSFAARVGLTAYMVALPSSAFVIFKLPGAQPAASQG